KPCQEGWCYLDYLLFGYFTHWNLPSKTKPTANSLAVGFGFFLISRSCLSVSPQPESRRAHSYPDYSYANSNSVLAVHYSVRLNEPYGTMGTLRPRNRFIRSLAYSFPIRSGRPNAH